MRTEAENHRLVLAHTHLCPMLASGFRGSKGISFDELEGAAMAGLCEAAIDWDGIGQFARFANTAICNQIKDFIRAWDQPPTTTEDPEIDFPHQVIEASRGAGSFEIGKIYEWQSWGPSQWNMAISEHWEWAELAATPEGLTLAWDEINRASKAIRSALIGFTKREREIFDARFFRFPRQSIDGIARHHEISYARAVFLIERMLRKIKDILESREAATPAAVRG